MKEVALNFNTEDAGLNLTGVVNFPERVVPAAGYPDTLRVRGLAEWRHVPANVVHVNERMLMSFKMQELPTWCLFAKPTHLGFIVRCIRIKKSMIDMKGMWYSLAVLILLLAPIF